MKKQLLIILFLVFGYTLSNAQNGIFFSEYFEGASNDKAIEIYNGNSNGISIPLPRLRVRLYANGASSPTNTLTLSLAEDGVTNSLAWNTTFVIYHSSFATPSTNLPNAPTSRRIANSTAVNFNGDDALELQYDIDGSGAWTTVDVFGEIGFDPGNAWGTGNTTTVNNGIIRKSSVNTGRSNAVFTPSDEYVGRSASADVSVPVSTLGSHTIDAPLPVQLSSFTANPFEGKVQLNWSTATEVNNYGFEILRSTQNDWEKIGFVAGHGNSNSPKDYSFTDANAPKGNVSYRLKQIDTDGSFSYSDVVTVNNVLAKSFKLYSPYPNPFNPSTTIKYSIPSASNVSLKIYDVIGNEVASLVNERKDAGEYEVNFNAKDLPSGIYFSTLRSNGNVQTQKLILIK